MPPSPHDIVPLADPVNRHSAEEEVERLLRTTDSDIDANASALVKQPGSIQEGRNALWSFYTYSWASEVYAVVSLTLFLPVTLEQYAREAGDLATDHLIPCYEATSVCEVQLMGMWTNTASFSLYTYSISVLLQALTVITISKEANDEQQRRRLLILFTLLGGTSCLLFLVIPSGSFLWPASALFTILGNVAFGSSLVCLNAYLPSLARSKVASKEYSLEEVRDTHEALAKTTSTISSKGIAAGYTAGILLLLLLLVPVTILQGNLWSLRIAIAATGIWWLGFSVRGFYKSAPWLRYPSTYACTAAAFFWLPRSRSANETRTLTSSSITQPWKELYAILLQYREIPEMAKYLVAWFLMSDAFSTITSTAVLFAKTTLGMQTPSLIFVGVLTPVFGILGALAWPKLQQSILKTSNLATLRFIVLLAVLIPIYGLLALTTPAELFFLSCYFGFLYGALQSYSRAVFSSLIPISEEARFFSLYSITDKSSSFLGPALVALLADKTGSVRAGFAFLVVALVAPLPILWTVDVEKGANEAKAYNSNNNSLRVQESES